MRYLIIGGTSVFGERLVDLLLAKENTDLVVATSLLGEDKYSRNKLIWKELDLRDVELTNRVVKESLADVIFDFATQNSVGYSWDHPTETVDINVVGTINLLNAVRDFSEKSRLVIGGSGEEYGKLAFSELPVKEETNPNPNNIYGATKACQTMFAKLYHQAFGMDIVVLRTFYETSVDQDERFAISSFCKQFAEIEKGIKKPIIDAGNVCNIRDFTDVTDIVSAFDLVSQYGKSGEIYNAARGKAITLLDIIKILTDITGIETEIKMNSIRVRPMDSPAMVANVQKIKEDCGWTAKRPIEETIGGILEYWRQKV